MADSVGIYGAGKWGMAISSIVGENANIKISSRTKREIKNFVSKEELLKQEYIVLVIAAQYIKDFLQNSNIGKNQNILIASKGIDVNENKFLYQICEDYLDLNNVAFLTGPSFANEVMQKLPTTLNISSTNTDLANKFKTFFNVDFIKVYVCKDIIGTEIAGAYKNTIAIAGGICDGLKLGNNAKASLISRGLVEMHRFGIFFGAKSETFLGISGSGDLFLTANSPISRNYRLGLVLADGKTTQQGLDEIKEVVEGVQSTYAICSISKKHDIYTPIALQLQEILLGGDVRESVKKLLGR